MSLDDRSPGRNEQQRGQQQPGQRAGDGAATPHFLLPPHLLERPEQGTGDGRVDRAGAANVGRKRERWWCDLLRSGPAGDSGGCVAGSLLCVCMVTKQGYYEPILMPSKNGVQARERAGRWARRPRRRRGRRPGSRWVGRWFGGGSVVGLTDTYVYVFTLTPLPRHLPYHGIQGVAFEAFVPPPHETSKDLRRRARRFVEKVGASSTACRFGCMLCRLCRIPVV